VTDWASRVTSYDYYPDGALQAQTNVNGTVGTYAYDNARRLTDVWNRTSTSATDAITRHQFTMDAVGNRTQVAETLAPVSAGGTGAAPTGLPVTHLDPGSASTPPSGLPTGYGGTGSTAPTALPNRPGPSTGPTDQTLVYDYDRLYRLTSASGGPAGSTSYTYDPVGNRLTRVRGSTSLSYAYDRADRISAAGAVSYTVDAVGNMTARGSDTLSYDQLNRLTGINFSSPSTSDASYAYDGDGKRVSKTVGSSTASYLYDTNRGLTVLLEDGNRRYVWGLRLAYEVEGTSALVYHVDGLGSVRAITDASQAVVQTHETDEFGVPITTAGSSTQPFGFTGEQRDPESSFVYLRARLYDPIAGRLLQRDRIGVSLTAPQLQNRFAYALNNPTKLTDPSGLTPDVNGTPDFYDETLEFYDIFLPEEICEMRRIPLSESPTDLECGGGAGGRGGSGRDGGWGGRGGGGAGGRGLSASQERAIRSLEQQIAEHREKLDAYRANPDAFDNQGRLQNAPNPEIRQRIIDGRIRHLETEIAGFERQVRQILGLD
jgi:RHS repeat-associated protein